MRIHFIVRSLRQEGAGSHQNALSYIKYLKERGHSVTVHAIASSNNLPADIQVITHTKETLGLIAGNEFLTKLLFSHEKDADVFFLYGVDFIWGAGRYRKNGGAVPVAIYLDTCLTSMDTGQRQSTVYYLKRVVWDRMFGMRDAPWVDAYIASSPFIKDIYVRYGFPKCKFSIVPNFFEFSAEHPVHEESVLPVVRLLYAGRLTYDKGTDLLITAVKGIPQELPWQLRIVGNGPLQEECENLIRKYELNGRVEIASWVDQSGLQEMYRSADIFIHPSRCPEASGRTLVEAMSRGIPVIASDTGAAPWTVGEAGIFFSKGNVAELRAAILKLITDAPLRERLGGQGETQAQKFRKGIIAPRLEEALMAVTGSATSLR